MPDIRIFFKFGGDAALFEQYDDFFDLFTLNGRIQITYDDGTSQAIFMRRFNKNLEEHKLRKLSFWSTTKSMREACAAY